MGVDLYSHQINAMNKLRNGNILQGGVGLGKSRTAIAYYLFRECDGEVPINGIGGFRKMKNPRDLYIITTSRKRDTLDWEKECAPFCIGTTDSYFDIHLKVDSWNNIKKYKEVKDAFFIFDEQRVVGYGAWSKAFIKISAHNHWILLTATPGDKWLDYIPVFIANGFYKNKSEFMNKHVLYSRYSRYPKVDSYLGVKELEQHKRDILVVMECERSTIPHHIERIADYDKERYSVVMKQRWNPYDSKPIKNISELCYLLRKVANDHPSRIDIVDHILKEHSRVVVFYNFNYELETLVQYASQNDIPYSQWNGFEHQLVPKGSKWIYLIQYTAGAEGWNCTETDTMIFYSQNYSYRSMVQASGRIDRMNTKYTDLYYYHIRSTAQIDRAILKALNNKKDFNEAKFLKA